MNYLYEVFLLIGFLIGLFLSDFSAKARYQQLLKSCARTQTPEKFIDGDLYYIVPASTMNRLLTKNPENLKEVIYPHGETDA